MISSPMPRRRRGEVLQRGRVLGAGGDDDGVLHRAVLLEHRRPPGDLDMLLADGDVDADQAFALLVDDRVEARPSCRSGGRR